MDKRAANDLNYKKYTKRMERIDTICDFIDRHQVGIWVGMIVGAVATWGIFAYLAYLLFLALQKFIGS